MELLFLHPHNSPRLKYNEKTSTNFRSRHWGQRKLLLSELLFLTQYGHLSTTILYVGSAPGNHIPYLMSLFPKHQFIFYDSTPFSFSETEQCTIYNRYFNEEDALQYSTTPLLFISDIRNLTCRQTNINARCEEIYEDMLSQKHWIELCKPVMSMLKFRLHWNEGITNYFNGNLLLQPWAKLRSIETRLITNGKEYRDYNNKEYEEQCCYHNEITRNESIISLSGHKLNDTWDTWAEVQILREYLGSKWNPAQVVYMMKMICKHCGDSTRHIYK